MAEPPTCKKCGQDHWRFKPCPDSGPEQQPPGEVIWPAPPEGYRESRFGDSDMLSRSLDKLGFGAPGLSGFTRPKRRS